MRNTIGWSLSYLLIAMLSIQYGASIAKDFFAIAGNAGTTTFRTFFAAIILLIIWRPWRKRFSRSSWKALTGYGLALGFMNLLFYMAISRIPLGIAVTLEFTG
ncbi:MAG: EamA family transporter, partial [Proteobacteria bacterium]